MPDGRVEGPCAYRESIAQVFHQLRPNVKVITAEPHELAERVIFSEATGLVRVPVRVELYPGYGPRSVTGVGEERSAIEELQLSVIDRAERLAQ
jgi:cysteine synthase